MKLFVAVLLAVLGSAIAGDTDIDWSTVRPLWQIKEWQDKHPMHMEIVRATGRLDHPQSFSPNGRITGGFEADRHQFPYMVGLVTHLTSSNGFCGGSLVSKNYVMTAAHCLDTAASVISVLGAHNVQTQNEVTQQRIFSNSTFFTLYPGWNAEQLLNDLAVVRLTSEANYGDYIRSVRLPNLRQTDVTFVNQLGTVTGWGRTTQWNSDLSPSLQFVRLTVITNLACRTRFPTSNINEDHVCADGGAGGPCNGDMGGPYTVTEADGRTTQIGIVSFGLGFACESSWPSVYLRVTSYLDWLNENTDGTISENWN